jgi:hypothetical protein
VTSGFRPSGSEKVLVCTFRTQAHHHGYLIALSTSEVSSRSTLLANAYKLPLGVVLRYTIARWV